MGTPTQRARHDGESGLALAAVVAATRDHRMTFPIEARVRRVTPNLSVPELYEVRVRGRDGRFEATSAACDLSYNPRTGRERLVVPPSTGQPGFTRERDWPWFSPTHRVLAMFAPAELGIWGGTHDQHRPHGARRLDERTVRIDLVRREEPAETPSSGLVEVDLGNAVVTRMQLEDDLYTLEAARVVMDASVTGPVVGPALPGWPRSFAP